MKNTDILFDLNSIVLLLDLNSIVLLQGSHTNREDGVCFMEAVAWAAGEPHSDHPACVDVVLAAYGRALNDRLKDNERQLLKPLLMRVIGTRGSDDLANRRAYLLVDRHVRMNLPAFFRELPCKPQPDLAAKFEALPPVIDAESAYQVRDLAFKILDSMRCNSLPAKRVHDAAVADAVYAVNDAVAAAFAYATIDAADAIADAASVVYADPASAADFTYAVFTSDFAAANANTYAFQKLRCRTIERAIESFEAAIALK